MGNFLELMLLKVLWSIVLGAGCCEVVLVVGWGTDDDCKARQECEHRRLVGDRSILWLGKDKETP